MKWPLILRTYYDAAIDEIKDLELANSELKTVNGKLRMELGEARKNDNRDPETGQYVKGE